MTGNITFRGIERQLGIADEARQQQEPLESWYESIRDTPIVDLGIEDVCKACRQELYIEYVIPEAIERLQHDPLAGEKYDGELLVALGNVPREYWAQHVEHARMLGSIVGGLNTADADLRADVAQLSARLPTSTTSSTN